MERITAEELRIAAKEIYRLNRLNDECANVALAHVLVLAADTIDDLDKDIAVLEEQLEHNDEY